MRIVVGGLVLVAALTFGPAQVPAGKHDEGAVQRLIRQLGSRKYAEREVAARKLAAVGESALPALRRAARTADLEIRRRAEQLVHQIEVEAEAARLLAGKRVRLVYKATPVLEAVEDLAARTGLEVRVEGDLTTLKERTVTLDTGATTAWEALAAFCRKAGLAEPGTPARLEPDDAEGEISLVDARSAPLPCHLAGALRIRALPAQGTPDRAGPACGFLVEASPDPTMPWYGVVGVRLSRAVDERGQELVRPSLPGPGTPVPLPAPDRPAVWDAMSGQPVAAVVDRRALSVWLAAGKQPSARLKEVRGVLTIQVPVVRELLTVDGIAEAEGKTFEGDHGRSVKVVQVKRTAGALTLRVQVRSKGAGGASSIPLQVVRTPKGQLVMRGRQRDPLVGFTLEDAEGNPVRPLNSRRNSAPNRGGGLLLEYEVTFPLKAGQPVPGRLVCRGPRLTALDIPFTLRDVPLTTRGTPANSPVPPR
jgi:hypothetical protein